MTPIDPVGRVGVPVKIGEARRAYDAAATHPSCAEFVAFVALVARVAVAAFHEIFIPAVPGEILAGLREVRPAPFQKKLPAVTDHPTSAFPESQRFAHLFPVAPSSF